MNVSIKVKSSSKIESLDDSINISRQQINNLNAKDTIAEILIIFFPTMLFYLGLFLQESINLIFVRRNYDPSKRENVVNAIGISNLYINFTLLSISIGTITAFETLGSNAYSYKNYYLLGIYFHRSQLIGFFISFSLVIFHYFYSIKIISLIIKDERIIIFISEYIKPTMLFVIFDVQFAINLRYLNILGKSNITLIIVIVCTLLHGIWCYLLIDIFRLGLVGAAYSIIISNLLCYVLSLMYIILVKPLPQSIFFYNKDSFRNWWNYLKFSIPSTFLMCIDWWAYEMLAVIAYWSSKEDFSAYVIISNIISNIFTVSIGLAMAISIITAKHICNKKLHIIRQFFSIIFLFSISLFIGILITLYMLKDYFIYLLFDKSEIVDKINILIPLYCFVLFFDMFQYSFASVFRGLGKQTLASWISFVNLYVIQGLGAILFGKIFDLGVKGVCYGQLVGCFFCSITYFLFFLKFDLKKIQMDTLYRMARDSNLVVEPVYMHNLHSN